VLFIVSIDQTKKLEQIIMPRRGKRENEGDDSLERSYVKSKRRSYVMSQRSRTEDTSTVKTKAGDGDEAHKSTNAETTSKKAKSSKSQGDGEEPSKRETVVGNKTTAADTRSSSSSSSANPNNNAKNENDKMERQQQSKRQRKERNKAKAEERRQRQQAQAEGRKGQAVALKDKKKQQQEEKQNLQQKSEVPDGQLVTTRKGVQYQDIIVGTGPEVKTGKQIQVKYTLRAAPGKGKVIDSSDNFGLRLGRSEVIEGWDIGLKGMKRGGLRHLIIPPQAGYGQQNIGAGKGALLYFEIKVLAC
jgi:FKBP-type peptidyl-prolyl cis-trans isomerase